MRRVTAFSTAALVAISTISAAVARPAPHGYYVIRWNNTGICQIWNTELQQQPSQAFSQYKIVSKPAPTFAAAASIQENMRMSRACTL